jgi:hypothetical protein
MATMKRKVYTSCVTIIFIAIISNLKAQNIFPSAGSAGIGTTTPNISSALEIKSTTQGILIPRMTKAQRDAIASPATGLLIYQTTITQGFFYYNGSAWVALSPKGVDKSLSNLTAPTAVNVDFLPSTDSLINIGDSIKSWKNFYLKGKLYFGNTLGMFTNAHDDFFAGPNAGHSFSSPLNGQRNTGIGANALYYGGYSNTAVGWKSLSTDSTGYYNAAVGALALLNNESGNENTAMGNAAMYKAINGDDNTAMGSSALEANFSGSNNVAIGAYALFNGYNSESNTAIGYQSQYSSTTGFNNSSLGYNALYNNNGFQNTAVGYNAGSNVTTGDENTFIGTNANCGSTGLLENGTALGYAATVTSSNHVHIGNTSVTSIGGQVGWSTFSDGRIKNKIQQNVPGLAFINLLNPVTYHFDLSKQEAISGRKDSASYKGKYDIEKIQFTGFIAQDVEAAAKKIGYDFSGVDAPASDKDLYALRYSDFVVPLVKAVQELSKKNDAKDSVINALKNNYDVKINGLQNEINELKTMIVSNQSISSNLKSAVLSSASLSQNIPNPFSNSTTINYSIPQSFSSAKIIITDKTGRTIKEINIATSGKGNMTISSSAFSQGVYQYSLYVNNKLVDTKQMILSK